MLQQIHDRAQGWFAWAIIILISVPFALWGIQSYLGGGAEPVAAEVNGHEITERALDQRVQNARIQLRERLGAAYDPAQFDDKRLRREVLNDMIRETLITDASARMGLRVSDQELRAQILVEPAFQSDGRFNNAQYEQILKYQGMSPAMFEAQLRQRIIGSQLARAIAGSELVTRTERAEYQRLAGQQRELAWLRIPSARFMTEEPIEEQTITAYYDANPARFQVPEQVKLDYLVLDIGALATKTEVSDDDLRRAYDGNQGRFGQPERRRVSHILLTLPPDANAEADAAVRQEIEGVRQRIAGGEAFDAVARAVSKDPGSASQGGSLGDIEKGIMDPAFEEAAFSLPVGTLSEPVRSRFGYHLIQVEAVTPAAVKPFEEVREQLRTEIARQKSEALFYDQGERLANLVFENPDTMEPAARELGLEVMHSDWITRTGGQGVLAYPKVTAAAFSDEVLTERRNSELIEPEKDVLQSVVVRVVDHRDASSRPLAEVREEIVGVLRRERAQKAAAAAAAAAAEKLRAGADWPEVAGEDKPEGPALIGRNDAKVPAPVRTAAFTLPPPAAGKTAVTTATLEDGDTAVLRVTKVEDGKVEDGKVEDGKVEDGKVADQGQGAADPAAMLGQILGRRNYDAAVTDMESRAKIERLPVAGRDGG